MNHMHLVNFHHLYMNKNISINSHQNQYNLENIPQQYLPLVIVYFQPNVDFLFI